MALTTCAECAARISTAAAACPSCGAPIEVATGRVDSAKLVVVLATLGFVGYMLWQHFAPRLGAYQLLSGHVACPTEPAVVQVRGAGLLLGRGGVSTVQVGGRTMYADHGGFEKR